MSNNIDIEHWIRLVDSCDYLQRRKIIHKKFKRFIYKYKAINPESEKSIDHLRDILVKSKLWLSSPLDFNDPFDMSANISVDGTRANVRKRIENILQQSNLNYSQRQNKLKMWMAEPSERLEIHIREVYQQSLQEMGIFSFAGKPNNILMWSHYALDHTGICIQFERAHDFKKLGYSQKVKYSRIYPIVDWVAKFSEDLTRVMLQKYEDWGYENEERIVRPGDARKYISFAPKAITAIIFGCRITESIREAVLKLLYERKEKNMPPIKLYSAKEHDTKYELKIHSHTD